VRYTKLAAGQFLAHVKYFLIVLIIRCLSSYHSDKYISMSDFVQY